MEGNLIGTPNDDSQFISFQDFSPINRSGGAGQAQLDLNSPNHQQNFGNLGNDSTGIGMIEDPPGLPRVDDGNVQKSFWTLEYYQKFFNVDTHVVAQRIKRSMLPHAPDNYLTSHIRSNPDLYGPFWICITLVFSIAISGNIANYLQAANSGKFHWRYDFHMVSVAATCIFLYAWLLPVVLWGALRWTSSAENTDAELIESNSPPGILELLCLYGYSLAIYIPVAFLLTIQISWLQWSLVGISILLSGGVLVQSLLPTITGKQKPIYMAVILGMHILLATGFMLYFFYDRSKPTSIVDVVTIPPTPTLASVVQVVANLSKPIQPS